MTSEQQLEYAGRFASMETTLLNQVASTNELIKMVQQLFELNRESLRCDAEFREKLMSQDESLRRAHTRIDESNAQLAKAMEHSREVKDTANKWINRGWGVVVVGAALMSLVQWVVLDRIRTYERNTDRNSESIITVDRRLSWMEYEVRKKK